MKNEHYDRGENDLAARKKYCTGQSLFVAHHEIGLIQLRVTSPGALIKLKPDEKKALARAEAIVGKMIERWRKLK